MRDVHADTSLVSRQVNLGVFAVLSYLTFCVSVGIQEPCVIRGVIVLPFHLFCVW